MEMIILKSKALRNPCTLKSGTIADVSITISAFMTKIKSPKVIMVKGSVRIRRNGLMSISTSAKTILTRSATQKFFTFTPGRM